MRRGTTPTHTFTLPFDTELIKSAQVVYSQGGNIVLKKKTEDLTLAGKTITYKMKQEESLAFDSNTNVDIQVRVLLDDGDAFASDIKSVYAAQCLDDEVLA